MKFPDHLYLEPDDCWDDEPESPVDEDRLYDHWKEQKIIDEHEKEINGAMSEKPFKASNGFEIVEEGVELFAYDKHGVFYTTITATFGDTLREYFCHVRDTELGRVRWPEDPDYVIYRAPEYDDDKDGRRIRVLHEPSGVSARVWERLPVEPQRPTAKASRWYFTEGPGKPERPWENAKAGEVWRLTVYGEDDTFLVRGDLPRLPYFFGQVSSFDPVDGRITAGRKLIEADGTPAEGHQE